MMKLPKRNFLIMMSAVFWLLASHCSIALSSPSVESVVRGGEFLAEAAAAFEKISSSVQGESDSSVLSPEVALLADSVVIAAARVCREAPSLPVESEAPRSVPGPFAKSLAEDVEIAAALVRSPLSPLNN